MQRVRSWGRPTTPVASARPSRLACKCNGRTFSGIEQGGPLAELMQLANLATLVEGPFDYDTVSGRVLNSERADRLLHREYRSGWTL